VLSYITEAETSITAGNTTDASDKLGLAVAELSNLIGEISSDNGRHTDTHAQPPFQVLRKQVLAIF
jgi:hypothetical protein